MYWRLSNTKLFGRLLLSKSPIQVFCQTLQFFVSRFTFLRQNNAHVSLFPFVQLRIITLIFLVVDIVNVIAFLVVALIILEKRVHVQ